MALQDRLDAFKKDLRPTKLRLRRRDHAQGDSGPHRVGQADRALKAGAAAPAFELPDAHGNLMRSADLARGPVVITLALLIAA